MKQFGYLPLGKELKAQTGIAKKQYKELNKLLKSDKKEQPIIKKEKQTIKKYNKSDLIYNSKHSFYKYYCDSKNFNNLSFKSKNEWIFKWFK